MQRGKSDFGSEVVQFTLVVPLLLAVMFAVVYAACYVVSALVLDSELSQACSRFDTVGLVAAKDKPGFIAEEIIDESSQLSSSNIQVSNVDVSVQKRSLTSGQDALEQHVRATTIAFDVAYRLPVSMGIPGLSNAELAKHVVCEVENERVMEVSMT